MASLVHVSTVIPLACKSSTPLHFTNVAGSIAASTTRQTLAEMSRLVQDSFPLKRVLQGSIDEYMIPPSALCPASEAFANAHCSAWVFPGSSLEKPVPISSPAAFNNTAPTLYAELTDVQFSAKVQAFSIHFESATWPISGQSDEEVSSSAHTSDLPGSEAILMVLINVETMFVRKIVLVVTTVWVQHWNSAPK